MAKPRLTQTKACNFNVHLMSVKLKFGTVNPFGYVYWMDNYLLRKRGRHAPMAP